MRTPRIVHSTSVWLPLTQNWMYQMLTSASAAAHNIVVCDRTANEKQFSIANLRVAARQEWHRRIADRAARTVRIRRYPALLLETLRNENADILHSHFGDVGWTNIRAAERAGVRHVVTFYGLDVGYLPSVNPRWRKRYPQMFRAVDRVLCEGAHMAEQIVKLGCPPNKVMVHRIGVDTRAIAFRPRQKEVGEPLRVLLAAGFREKKGLPIALEALGRLQNEGVPVQVTVIGDAGDDEASQAEKRRIVDAVHRGGLRPNVRFLGYRSNSEMHREAYTHHILLQPSVTAANGDTEGGSPVTITELAASGMLIVSTRHADIPEVIVDGETGLLADERDVDGLVERLRWLNAHTEEWARMAQAARARVTSRFDLTTQAQQLSGLYKELAR